MSKKKEKGSDARVGGRIVAKPGRASGDSSPLGIQGYSIGMARAAYTQKTIIRSVLLSYRILRKELRLWIAPPAFWRSGSIQGLPD